MAIWKRIARVVVIVLGIVALAITALPIVPSNEWWIRIWDFPRSQILIALTICLLLSAALFNWRWAPVLVGMAMLVAAAGWQAYRIWPYTQLAPVEAHATASCPSESRIVLLTANVLVSNRTAEPLLALVERTQPDVLLLVETDDWWDQQLAPLKQDYPEQIARPKDNGYGMHLFSRFPLLDSEVRYLLEDYVSSIKAVIRLPSGNAFTFYGVHPVPPPLQDTAQRDAEQLLIAREICREETAAIVAGDLNDVGWSRTTRLFQEISGALDPRIGRGRFSTFNANWPMLRWPLDHVFFDPSFLLMDMQIMEHIGSDHFPLLVELCHAPDIADVQRQPAPLDSEQQRASEAIEQGREAAGDP